MPLSMHSADHITMEYCDPAINTSLSPLLLQEDHSPTLKCLELDTKNHPVLVTSLPLCSSVCKLPFLFVIAASQDSHCNNCISGPLLEGDS